MIREGLREIFRRTPGRYESIDGIRALAVIWVIYFHTIFGWGEFVSSEHYEAIVHASWNWFWTKGYLAINPFFVISGFLIGDLLMRERERTGDLALRSFYVRRFFRLAPAYYLVLAGHAAFWFHDPSHYSLKYLWANVVYVNNWLPFRDQPAIWSWSLAVEEQFYLVAPFLLLGLARLRRGALGVIFVLIGASLAWNFYCAHKWGPFKVIYRPQDDWDAYYHFFDHTYAQTLTRASGLLLGVACAYLKRDAKWMGRFASPLGAGILAFFFLGIGFVTLNPAVLPPGGTYSKPIVTMLLNPLSAFSFACLVLLLLARRGLGRPADRFLGAPVWYPFAQISYGLYLLHVPVVYFYFKFVPPGPEIRPWPLTLHATAILAVTTLFAVALNVFVETPMRKLGYRISNRAAARERREAA